MTDRLGADKDEERGGEGIDDLLEMRDGAAA
jgi:hypothetical protein